MTFITWRGCFNCKQKTRCHSENGLKDLKEFHIDPISGKKFVTGSACRMHNPDETFVDKGPVKVLFT